MTHRREPRRIAGSCRLGSTPPARRGTARIARQCGTSPGRAFPPRFGLMVSDFFIASAAPGGMADGCGPGFPTTASGGGASEAPESPQPEEVAHVNRPTHQEDRSSHIVHLAME